eukprot:CAMPEP_0197632894 /NCGR_PEP_ID=MMETSP1338-20131121/9421_1 /TAXON_ID=43686 ORGANISM="Pelagodinium beii, Strain RCC1491" /NCGR_SAMPLE_ID=MMETSP1338 /ASSEMBLY_ACC=CAM_ASM_000754 /LENGTH=767 /DNA_ID=CAMNT_0043204471 /DNA_START=184 /DNA_END=2487 /DNA_ORIENTATION=+
MSLRPVQGDKPQEANLFIDGIWEDLEYIANVSKDVLEEFAGYEPSFNFSTVNDTFAEMEKMETFTGVDFNKEGDLQAVISGFFINSGGVVICIGVFLLLRSRYPMIYCYNLISGAIPEEFRPSESQSWIEASMSISPGDAMELVGLDVAMLLEFNKLSMRIMGFIGLPIALILAPLNFFVRKPAETDDLSRISIDHVPNGHPYMYYVYAVIVVFVCIVVKECVFEAQEQFMKLRYQWLSSLPYPRSNTVLVQGIPEEQRSADAVRAFFSKAFWPEAIVDVAMVMQTEELERLVAARCSAQRELHEGELVALRDHRRPRRRNSQLIERNVSVDTIDHVIQKVADFDAKIAREQDRITDLGKTARGGGNSQSAFVTFKSKRECEMAKHLRYSTDSAQWLIVQAPDPTTIRWRSLRVDQTSTTTHTLLGILCTAGVFLSFAPFCTASQALTNCVNLGPTLQPMWVSVAPSLGLSFFLAYLPSVLLIISDKFYHIRSSPRRQHSLQIMYFWFQVFFVLGVTCLDEGNIALFAEDLIRNPMDLPARMAEKMPHTTHFYINFILMQWFLESSYLTRYMTMGKFLIFKALYDDKEAHEMAEPEDQDFYGLGAKTANFTIYLLIGIIFGTMSPLIPVVVWVNQYLCCVVHGYCAVFAETGKPDLGGVFWVTQLRHTLMGTMMYCLLMIGLLYVRSPDDRIPCKVACAALGYAVFALYRFDQQFMWEDMSISQSCDEAETKPFQRRVPVLKTGHAELVENSHQSYVQPELLFKPSS